MPKRLTWHFCDLTRPASGGGGVDDGVGGGRATATGEPPDTYYLVYLPNHVISLITVIFYQNCDRAQSKDYNLPLIHALHYTVTRKTIKILASI